MTDKIKKKGSSFESVLGTESLLQMRLALDEFCDQQTPLSTLLMLQVLFNMHMRIKLNPTVDKFYRVYIKGKVFHRYVWVLEGAPNYMQFAGWVKCGNYLILSKSYPVQQNLSVIEEVFRKKKKSQLAYSGSLQVQNKRSVSVRRAHSNVEPSIVEDDVTEPNVTSVQSERADVALNSDDELPGKARVKRVKSIPHTVGEEEYIVVDFIERNQPPLSPVPSQQQFLSPVPVHQPSPEKERSMSNSSSFFDIHVEAANNGPQCDDLHRKLLEVATLQDNHECEHETNDRKEVVTPVVSAVVDLPTSKNLSTDGAESLVVSPTTTALSVNTNLSNNKAEEGLETNVPSAHFEKTIEVSKPAKKKVFSAGKGLKKLKKTANNNDLTMEEVYKRASSSDSSIPASPKMVSSPESQSITSQRSSSSSPSARSSRSNSLKNSEPLGVSIVAQNKLLFDQQAANRFNRRPKESVDPLRPRSQLDYSSFIGVKQSNSFSGRVNPSVEVDTAGIVSGARAMFENAGKIEKRLSVKSLPDKERSRSLMDLCPKKVDSSPTNDNPLLSHFKDTDSMKTKKKKFPLKKHAKKRVQEQQSPKQVPSDEKLGEGTNKGYEEVLPSIRNSSMLTKLRQSESDTDAGFFYTSDTVAVTTEHVLEQVQSPNVSVDSTKTVCDSPEIQLDCTKREVVSTELIVESNDVNEGHSAAVDVGSETSHSDVRLMLGNIIERQPSFGPVEKDSKHLKKKVLLKKKRKSDVNKQNSDSSQTFVSAKENLHNLSAGNEVFDASTIDEAEPLDAPNAALQKEKLTNEALVIDGDDKLETPAMEDEIQPEGECKLERKNKTIYEKRETVKDKKASEMDTMVTTEGEKDKRNGSFSPTIVVTNANGKANGDVKKKQQTMKEFIEASLKENRKFAASNDTPPKRHQSERSFGSEDELVDMLDEVNKPEEAHSEKKKKRFPFLARSKKQNKDKPEPGKLLRPKSLDVLTPRSKARLASLEEGDEKTKKKKVSLFKRKKKSPESPSKPLPGSHSPNGRVHRGDGDVFPDSITSKPTKKTHKEYIRNDDLLHIERPELEI